MSTQIPCIILDEATGWTEIVEDGWNILVGANKEKIIGAVKQFEPEGKQRDIFGAGRAAGKIVKVPGHTNLSKIN